jgi:hypothetical protein
MKDFSWGRCVAPGLGLSLLVIVPACGASTGVEATGGGGSFDGGVGGSSNIGGSHTGGSSNGGRSNGGGSSNAGGSSTGDSSGSGGAVDAGVDAGIDAGSGCPTVEPAIGTACSPPGLHCTYGNVCCGHGRECEANGQWQIIPVGCACIVIPSEAGVDAGTSCGNQTCIPNQVCVHPPTSRGGPVPLCVAQPDAGVCPPGTEWSSICAGSSNGGCIETFVPDPPSCAPIPSTCGNPLQCGCFSSNICGGGANLCISVDRSDLRCANLAP